MSTRVRAAITAVASFMYLSVVALSIAAVWTSRSNDLSTELAGTAAVLVLGSLVGLLVGLALSAMWEEW